MNAVRQLRLPLELQDLILQYTGTHRKNWSRYWLKLSIQHIDIMKHCNSLFNAIISINANIGEIDHKQLDLKQICIEEFQHIRNIQPLLNIFDEECKVETRLFRY